MIDPLVILAARARQLREKIGGDKAAFFSIFANRNKTPPTKPGFEQNTGHGSLRRSWTEAAKSTLANLFQRFDRTYYSGNQQ